MIRKSCVSRTNHHQSVPLFDRVFFFCRITMFSFNLFREESSCDAMRSEQSNRNETKRTCATRPFHFSAFVFMPQGDCPSLKFHCRSANCVVVLLSSTIDVVDEKGVLAETDLPACGTKAAVFDASATTATRARSTRVENFWNAIVSK